jgi:hypothetical protein
MPPPPPSKCAAKKLIIAGKETLAFAKCHARAVRTGAALDSACFAKAKAKYDRSWAKVEQKGDCLTAGDQEAVHAIIDGFDGEAGSELPTALQTGPGPSACTARKLDTAGRTAFVDLKCYSKAARKGLAVDPNCLGRSDTKFGILWSKAELFGDCQTTNDVTAVGTSVESFVGDVKSALLP